ncbi:MAG: hypothetical protein H6644_21625 [Caldilineaceae bacterium]|nr:hypothetical protein [Caldilineaceae bacterium]
MQSGQKIERTQRTGAWRRLVWLLLPVAAVVLGATGWNPPTAQAAGTVTNCTWAGAGGLQAALAGGGAVTFACDGTIVVPEIVIAQDTVLDGTTHNVTLSGNNANRVLRGGRLRPDRAQPDHRQRQAPGFRRWRKEQHGAIALLPAAISLSENSVFENNKSLRFGR